MLREWTSLGGGEMKKENAIALVLPWMFVLTLTTAGEERISVQIEPGMSVSRMKILPDRTSLGFSESSGIVYKIASDGKLLQDVRPLDHRIVDSQHTFYDFCAATDGSLYVLGMFKEASGELRSAVFLFGNDGQFKRLINLAKKMDARGLTVDSRGNLIVLGLPSDFYFGQAKNLFLLHKFDQQGRLLRSFGEFNPASYPGGNAQNLYHFIRGHLNRVPIGNCGKGIFCVWPGTNSVNFFHPDTLTLVHSVRIDEPGILNKAVPASVSDKYGEYQRTANRIKEVQVDTEEIRAEFVQSQIYQNPNAALSSRLLVVADFTGKTRNSREVDASYGQLLALACPGYSRFCTLARQDGQPLIICRD